ncbi:MAG: MFS transporter, partial [Chloroflexia bacterium]
MMPSTPLTRRGLLPLLRNRHFLALWAAQAISQIGQNMLNYLVIVLVEQLTGSSTQTGLAILSFLIPGVLISGIAGVVVDRSDKRALLVGTTLLRAATASAYFVYLLHHEWPLGILVLIIDLATFMRTCVNQFFWPAESAAIGLFVAREHFFTVNTLLGISTNVFTVLGFLLLGPFLLKLFGVRTILSVIILCYLTASAILALLPRRGAARSTSVERNNGRSLPILRQAVAALRRELLESWQLIRRDRAITVSILFSSAVQALALMVGTLAPGYAVRVLGQRTEDAFLVVLPAGVGMFLGFLLVGPASRKRRWQEIVNRSMVVCGAALLGLALTPLAGYMVRLAGLDGERWDLWAALVCSFVLGATNPLIVVPT